MNATAQVDNEIRETILSMGADEVKVVREGNTMYVAFDRRRGCGRIYINVCSYLAKRFRDMKIVVLESPKKGKFCTRARVREAGGNHFIRKSVLATATCLGLV